ncbi:MAG: hypothetical protein ABEI75_04615 [Halobaculum sp.]
MNRRRFLESTLMTAYGSSRLGVEPPRTVESWEGRRFSFPIHAAVRAHDGGLLVAGATDGVVRLVILDRETRIQRRERVELPEEPPSLATLDLCRTEAGYAAAVGAQFVRLGGDLAVAASGTGSEADANRWTRVARLGDGFVVAAEVNYPNHVSTTVFGFDRDGSELWTARYGVEQSSGLGFVVSHGDTGVVGGGFGDFWLASVAADGTTGPEREFPDRSVTPTPDAAPDGRGGFVVFAPPYLFRVNDTRSVVWHRRIDGLLPNPGRIARLGGGGYAAVTGEHVLRLAADGAIRWRRQYAPPDGSLGAVHGLVPISDDRYLAAGVYDEAGGWVVRLSRDGPLPTATPTASPTPTQSPTPPSTTNTPETGGGSATDSDDGESDSSGTGVSTPGFGVLAGGAGVAGFARWLRRRDD